MCVDDVPAAGAPAGLFSRGQRRPLFAGASKVILAYPPPHQLRALFAPHRTAIAGAGLGADWEAFRTILRGIRDAGHSVTVGEFRHGILGIAAPLFNQDGSVLGSLGIATQVQRVSSNERARLADIVIASAGEAGRRIAQEQPLGARPARAVGIDGLMRLRPPGLDTMDAAASAAGRQIFAAALLSRLDSIPIGTYHERVRFVATSRAPAPGRPWPWIAGSMVERREAPHPYVTGVQRASPGARRTSTLALKNARTPGSARVPRWAPGASRRSMSLARGRRKKGKGGPGRPKDHVAGRRSVGLSLALSLAV
jgi:hypothetical protein